jgi:hypothetical protein
MSVAIAIADVLHVEGMPASRRGVEKLLNRIGAQRIQCGLYQARRLRNSPVPDRCASGDCEVVFPSEASEGAARAESGRSPHAGSVPADQAGGERSVLERGSRKDLERADAQTEIVLAFRNFHQQTGGTRKAALRAFVAQFNQCRIEGISAEARARNLTLTNPTLLRWLRKF